jgi:hypothetical protein
MPSTPSAGAAKLCLLFLRFLPARCRGFFFCPVTSASLDDSSAPGTWSRRRELDGTAVVPEAVADAVALELLLLELGPGMDGVLDVVLFSGSDCPRPGRYPDCCVEAMMRMRSLIRGRLREDGRAIDAGSNAERSKRGARTRGPGCLKRGQVGTSKILYVGVSC